MASDPFIQVGTPQSERGFNPLPDQSERSVFTRPPSGPTPADFLDKINYRGLDRLGAGLTDIQNQVVLPEINRQAAEEGAASVARDPTTGEITVVGGLHSNFLPWGRAYNDAAHKTFVLETDAQSKTAIQDIFQKNRDDPQKAKALADTYIKSLAAKAPPDFRSDIALKGTQTAEQYLRGAVLEKSDRDTQRFIASSKAQIDDDTSTFVSLAGTPGGTSTPEFQQAHARVVKGWTDLAANPLTSVTPEVADHQISLIERRAKAEAILSNLHYGTEGLHVVQSALGAGQKGDISAAIFAQESGSGANAKTSVDGAVGPSQILPATARQHGLDPAKLNDPQYATAAREKILADLRANPKIGNDPARIAVAYFSGEGNVAPPGSDKPYIHDTKDGNGKHTSAYVADVLDRIGGSQSGSATGKEEAIAELRSLHLEPDETVTMINRAEGVVSDIQTEHRQALADAEHVRNLMSESTLKGVFEEAAHGTLTTQKVDALATRLTADDYKTAMQMARGGGYTDNRNTVADLVVALDSTDPSTYKSRVVSAMRSGELTADTGRTMINQNRTAYSEGGPPTPYKQGRDYVKNALNPGELTKDYGGRLAQSNALVEYDQWYAAHPEATADDANEQARKITQTYSVVEANQLPLSIGRPYGYTGQPTAASITVVELKRAQQRLESDYKAKRIGPDQLRSETRRLQAWKELLDRQKAKLP